MSRLTLQTKLEELLKSKEVHYNPPNSIQMKYPAIRYKKKKKERRFANDAVYTSMDCYEIIVIAAEPDHPVIEKILSLPYSSWDRHYTASNLDHDVITLYY